MDFEVGGYRMHYGVFGDAAGEPLLWLHGWSGTGEDWKYIFKTPPDAFRVIGPDMHGNGGETQIDWLMAQTRAMAGADDDVNFTPSVLKTITARTLIVFGDIDPLYPVRLAFELRESIPRSSLWVVPNAGHGPVFGPHAP